MHDQPAHGACTLIKKDHYFDVGGHDESFECQDGVDIWLSLTEKYDVINVSKPLFYYRKHPQSLTMDEVRILSTRINIYINHAHRSGFVKEKTLAFIPVRSQKLSGAEYALTKLGDKTVIEWVVKKAITSDLVEKTIILVDEKTLSIDIKNMFANNPSIFVSQRDKKDSNSGISIHQSITNYLTLSDEKN